MEFVGFPGGSEPTDAIQTNGPDFIHVIVPFSRLVYSHLIRRGHPPDDSRKRMMAGSVSKRATLRSPRLMLLMMGPRLLVLHMQRAFSQKAALSFISIVATEKDPSTIPDSSWLMDTVDTNSKYRRHGGVCLQGPLFFFLVNSLFPADIDPR